MTSLKNCDPRLRRYLLIHRLPDVFEVIETNPLTVISLDLLTILMLALQSSANQLDVVYNYKYFTDCPLRSLNGYLIYFGKKVFILKLFGLLYNLLRYFFNLKPIFREGYDSLMNGNE